MTVLCAATRTNAELVERLDEIGTIEAGKRADMMLVDGHPLANIQTLKNVTTVIQSGVVYGPDQLLPMLPASEAQPPPDNLRRFNDGVMQ